MNKKIIFFSMSFLLSKTLCNSQSNQICKHYIFNASFQFCKEFAFLVITKAHTDTASICYNFLPCEQERDWSTPGGKDSRGRDKRSCRRGQSRGNRGAALVLGLEALILTLLELVHPEQSLPNWHPGRGETNIWRLGLSWTQEDSSIENPWTVYRK